MTDTDRLAERLHTLETQLAILLDRQAILDCSHRFCRGINRLDRELLRSAFHPDAIDDHGLFLGGVEEFITWIESLYADLQVTQHFVTNQTVDLSGDVAHAEQYWFVANVRRNSDKTVLRGGRYIDRFERREGIWAIAERACLIEWNQSSDTLEFDSEAEAKLSRTGIVARDDRDLSYQRPLRLRRPPPA